jgi:hypothetical protein
VRGQGPTQVDRFPSPASKRKLSDYHGHLNTPLPRLLSTRQPPHLSIGAQAPGLAGARVTPSRHSV